MPASFDLEAAPPTVAIDAKNRKAETLPLHPGLAAMLAHWIAPGSPLWDGNWAKRNWAAALLRRDLKAAGIPYRTAAGVADFHVLRHSFITAMGKAGVELSVRQSLARHSDPKLTMRYTHLGMEDLAGFVPALPAPAVSGAGPGAGTVAQPLVSPGSPWQGAVVGGENDAQRQTKGIIGPEGCPGVPSNALAAERVGFEPTLGLPLNQFSRLTHSTALPPLQTGRRPGRGRGR